MKGDNEMNKWNRLLAYLDDVFGFKNKIKSTFRKVGQSFDERTNEHVIHIEYRVRTSGDVVTKKRSGGRMIKELIKQASKKKQ